MTSRYTLPRSWIMYDREALLAELTEAKAAMIALTQLPCQRSWAEELQRVQLKREVAGTSRIEGAEFTDHELEVAMRESPEQVETRSQKQASAAVDTYRWIARLPSDRPVDEELVREVHRRLVTGCDDDHCPPGRLRGRDENVTFGAPRHRGVEGGVEGGVDCQDALRALVAATRTAYREHDPLVQALALHYHFAAMHPFLDGNGRTARALEALMLQRVGLRDMLFIAMSNYYYENKTAYLTAMNDTRAGDHDLTPFLKFALKGIRSQCEALTKEIRRHLDKALFRTTMADLFGRLTSPRKRALSARHVQLLNLMLDRESLLLSEITVYSRHLYNVKNPQKALIRDLNILLRLNALGVHKIENPPGHRLFIRHDWPMQITETEFFQNAKKLPKGKVYGFLSD